LRRQSRTACAPWRSRARSKTRRSYAPMPTKAGVRRRRFVIWKSPDRRALHFSSSRWRPLLSPAWRRSQPRAASRSPSRKAPTAMPRCRVARGLASRCASPTLGAIGSSPGSVPELERREAPEGVDLLAAVEVRAVERVVHYLDRPVVGRAVDREGCAVLAAVGEGVAGGIAMAGALAVDELGGERERAQGLGADAFGAEERLEIRRRLLVGPQQDLVQVARVDVALGELVVTRHGEEGHFRLLPRQFGRGRAHIGTFARD